MLGHGGKDVGASSENRYEKDDSEQHRYPCDDVHLPFWNWPYAPHSALRSGGTAFLCGLYTQPKGCGEHILQGASCKDSFTFCEP